MHFPELPLELGAIRQLADSQPDVARNLYYWALAMVMVERGKANLVEQQTADGQKQYTFASPEGEVVQVMKPAVSEALIDEMMTAVRLLVEEEFRQLAKGKSSDLSDNKPEAADEG
jgi:hypothetical protein